MGQGISKTKEKTKPDPSPFENFQMYAGGQLPVVPTTPIMYCNPDYVSQRMMQYPGNRYPDYYPEEYSPIPRPRSSDRPRRMEYLPEPRRYRDLEEMDFTEEEDDAYPSRRGRAGRMEDVRHLPRHRVHEPVKFSHARALSPVPAPRPHPAVSPHPHNPAHHSGPVYQPGYGIQPTVIYYDPANGAITATAGPSTVTPVPHSPPSHGAAFAQQQMTGHVPQTYVVSPVGGQHQPHGIPGQVYNHHQGTHQRY